MTGQCTGTTRGHSQTSGRHLPWRVGLTAFVVRSPPPSLPPSPVTVTCFHSLWECVGGAYSPDLLHPGWPHTQTFPKAFANPASAAVTQAGAYGTDRGPGCGKRPKKRRSLVAEGQAVFKANLREMDGTAWLEGILEVLASVEGRGGRNGNYRHTQWLKQRWKCWKETGRLKKQAWPKWPEGDGR